MECPLCNYVDGHQWNDDNKFEEVKGEHGSFYHLPINLERSEMFGPTERVEVYGCPSCKGMFLGD